jgi:hypothetical protein
VAQTATRRRSSSSTAAWAAEGDEGSSCRDTSWTAVGCWTAAASGLLVKQAATLGAPRCCMCCCWLHAQAGRSGALLASACCLGCSSLLLGGSCVAVAGKFAEALPALQQTAAWLHLRVVRLLLQAQPPEAHTWPCLPTASMRWIRPAIAIGTAYHPMELYVQQQLQQQPACCQVELRAHAPACPLVVRAWHCCHRMCCWCWCAGFCKPVSDVPLAALPPGGMHAVGDA